MSNVNEEFVRSQGLVPGTEAYQEILTAMEKYGENRWWFSNDPRTRAYYYILELDESGRGFISFEQIKQDLAVLLGRPVADHEFASENAVAQRQEVERAWLYGVGVISESEEKERTDTSINLAKDLAKKYGKKFDVLRPH